MHAPFTEAGLWRESCRGPQGPTNRDSPFQAYWPQSAWARSHAAHTLKGIKQGCDTFLNFCRGFWAKSPLGYHLKGWLAWG